MLEASTHAPRGDSHRRVGVVFNGEEDRVVESHTIGGDSGISLGLQGDAKVFAQAASTFPSADAGMSGYSTVPGLNINAAIQPFDQLLEGQPGSAACRPTRTGSHRARRHGPYGCIKIATAGRNLPSPCLDGGRYYQLDEGRQYADGAW